MSFIGFILPTVEDDEGIVLEAMNHLLFHRMHCHIVKPFLCF